MGNEFADGFNSVTVIIKQDEVRHTVKMQDVKQIGRRARTGDGGYHRLTTGIRDFGEVNCRVSSDLVSPSGQ